MKGSGFFAFLGGAAVGAAVALLFAPMSGEDARRKIKDFVDEKTRKGGCHAHLTSESTSEENE